MKIKHNNILLVCSFVLTILISYRFAIKKTLDLKREYNVLEKLNKDLKKVMVRSDLLLDKKSYYDSIWSEYNLDNGSFQNALLKDLNVISRKNNTKVFSFNEPHIYTFNESQTTTYSFNLQGNFLSILTTIHSLEKEKYYGEIVHINFYKKKWPKSIEEQVHADVLLKSFK